MRVERSGKFKVERGKWKVESDYLVESLEKLKSGELKANIRKICNKSVFICGRYRVESAGRALKWLFSGELRVES